MNTKNIFLTTVAAILLLCGCGSDDADDGGGSQTTVTPPRVLSTTPADETTDVAIGIVNVQVVYSKTVNMSSDTNLLPTITGGSLSGTPTVSGSTLSFTLNCPDYETTVSVTIPKGFIYINDAQAEAYTFSFTTAQQPVTPPSGNISATPLTSNAAAQRLYTYFYEQYGQKVISSVMADVNWNTKIADKVHTLTGKYPAMNCFDFIHIYVPTNNWINYQDITPVTDWVSAGGIVQLMWHFNVPINATTTPGSDGSGVTCTPSETSFKVSNALINGTWENQWFYQQMDKVIDVILQLQQQGIAATWRPFHEAAGNATLREQASWAKAWFWWGYDGADTYKKLWQAMYTYFKQKGVENLIWIWTTQNYNGDSNNYYQDTDWYPGDEYVDIVARDLYGSNAAQNAQEFTEIQSVYPTKMVVLGECGKGDNGEQGLMGDCWTQGAKWGHFMVWYQGGSGSTNTMCSDAWWRNAMQDANVITRDQLPNLK